MFPATIEAWYELFFKEPLVDLGVCEVPASRGVVTPKSSLMPDTPAIAIGSVLKSAWPRATDRRMALRPTFDTLVHASYSVNTIGLNVAVAPDATAGRRLKLR